MNELTITVAGWAASDPRMFVGQGDLAIVSFRVASTPRFFDRERSTWVDGVTEWFTVRVFRSAAFTVNKSIKKGMPVVVTGRLRTSTWESKEGTRVDHIIDATAVGPDCTRGVTETFARATGDASLTDQDVSAAAAAIAASRVSPAEGESAEVLAEASMPDRCEDPGDATPDEDPFGDDVFVDTDVEDEPAPVA